MTRFALAAAACLAAAAYASAQCPCQVGKPSAGCPCVVQQKAMPAVSGCGVGGCAQPVAATPYGVVPTRSVGRAQTHLLQPVRSVFRRVFGGRLGGRCAGCGG